MDEFRDRRRLSVLLGCFCGAIVSVPAVFSASFGVFLPHMIEETGWSRGIVSGGYSIASLTAAVLALAVGWLIDKYGSRSVITIGTLMFPAVLVLWSVMPVSVPAWFVVAALIGVSLSLLVGATYITVPAQWFVASFGVAAATVNVGTTIGQVAWPLVAEALAQNLDWRAALQFIAPIVAIVGIGSARLLIRNNPDHERLRRRDDAQKSLPGSTLRQALSSTRFYLLCATFGLVAFVSMAYAVHFVALLLDRGLLAEQAVLSITAFTIAAFAGRIVCGWMLDRWSYWYSGAIFIGAQVLGGLIIVAGWDGAAPFVAAALIGSAIGAETDIMPVVLRHFFGMKAFGRIYGAAFAFFYLGGAIGPVMMGVGFDRMHSYQAVLTGLIVADIAALACFAVAVGAARSSVVGAHAPATSSSR